MSRESRPEDIQRIAALEREIKKMEALVKQTQEEMKYFKLELLNREENFNKTFGRSPNTGVMQIVQPKAAVPGNGGAQVGGGNNIKRKQTRRRASMESNPGR